MIAMGLLAVLNPRVLADSNLAGYRHTELGDPDTCQLLCLNQKF